MAKRRKYVAGVADWQVQFLLDGSVPDDDEDDDINPFEVIDWKYHGALKKADPARPVWEAHREQIMAQWLSRHPGSRPYAWWVFDSGLQRKVAPMKVSERWTISRWRYTLAESIPEDQRAWLQEHGILQAGE